MESILKFGDVNWKCVGLISDSWESFFKIKDRWFKDNLELPTDAYIINNVIIAVLIKSIKKVAMKMKVFVIQEVI